ncbi:hypothetical protein [Thermogymnomonas acidicola]|uniref:hypothetical protein n=1 Tax=Thermogymnomonas acidicola TaxID=399579 RepID=UPI00094638E4|nr:hypothetical protein [Thermogymnomonas acidicola]
MHPSLRRYIWVLGIVVLLIGLFLLSYSLTVVRGGQSYVTIERPTFTREGGLYEYPIPGGASREP